MSIDGERAYGPGVSDMKSGLLNIVYALRELPREVRDRLSICVCMNPDEEIGSLHSSDWLATVAKQAKQVLVAEAARADGSLVKARKGMARYRIDFTGKAAHAGNEPQKGRSAITELGHWILAINALTNFESGTTLNIGIVEGGNGANIVPAHASAVVDVRFWDNQEYHQIRRSSADPGRASPSGRRHHPADPRGPQTGHGAVRGHPGTDATGGGVWRRTGAADQLARGGGGSDANLTAALGIPTLDGLGPIGAGFHSDEEYLDLASIAPRIELLVKVLTRLAA